MTESESESESDTASVTATVRPHRRGGLGAGGFAFLGSSGQSCFGYRRINCRHRLEVSERPGRINHRLAPAGRWI